VNAREEVALSVAPENLADRHGTQRFKGEEVLIDGRAGVQLKWPMSKGCPVSLGLGFDRRRRADIRPDRPIHAQRPCFAFFHWLSAPVIMN
jgi:hypothetical protein